MRKIACGRQEKPGGHARQVPELLIPPPAGMPPPRLGEPEELWPHQRGRTAERDLEGAVWEAALALLLVDPREPERYLPTLTSVRVPGAVKTAGFVEVLSWWRPPQPWPPWRGPWPPAALLAHTMLVNVATGAERARRVAELRQFCWWVLRTVSPPGRRRGQPRRTTLREVRERIEAYLRIHPPEKGVHFWSAAAGHLVGLEYPAAPATVTLPDEKLRVSLRRQQQRLRAANQFGYIGSTRRRRVERPHAAATKPATKPAASPPPLPRPAPPRRRTRNPDSQ